MLLWIQEGNSHSFHKLNRTLLTMIPKKENALEVRDYRPISLVHRTAKLAARTLSLGLAPILPSIMSPNQNAFIKGRAIHNNYMLVQQFSKAMHATNTSSALLKLYIARAFDSGVIVPVGAAEITSLTEAHMFAPPPGPEDTEHSRGVCQAEPLSLMLFILVMDVLHHLIQKADQRGFVALLSGCREVCRTPLYANNAVVSL